MTITLQFVRGEDFGAHAIEWFAHGADYSHVDTVMPDGRLLGARSDSVGGAPPGVQFRDPSYIGNDKVLRISLSMTPVMEERYYNFLVSQVGKPYDMEGIFAFIDGRDWRNPNAWFCSEYKTAALEECKHFPFPLATPANKMTPPDLIMALSVNTYIELP